MPSTNTHTLPRLPDYRRAWNFWSTATPVSRDTSVIRRLGNASQRQTFQIQQYSDRSIACRMYNTDIVTYYPDGRVHLQLWPSISTMRAIHALVPWAHPHWSERADEFLCAVRYNAQHPHVWVRLAGVALTYRGAPEDARWTEGVYPMADPQQTQRLWRPTVQRAEVRAYRDSIGWTPFKRWAMARITLGAHDIPRPDSTDDTPSTVVRLVRSGDPVQWEHVVQRAHWSLRIRRNAYLPASLARTLVAKIQRQCDQAGDVDQMVDWTPVPFVDDPQTALRWLTRYGAGGHETPNALPHKHLT